MTVKFYKCETCGNIITKLKDSSVNVVCCGNPMKELIPGEVDAAVEKHVPAVTIEGDKVTVKVGSVPHPMVENHYIEFIALRPFKAYRLNILSLTMKLLRLSLLQLMMTKQYVLMLTATYMVFGKKSLFKQVII